MARANDGTASNIMKSLTIPITQRPCTLACWFYVANVTTYYTLMGCLKQAAGSDSYAIIGVSGATAGDPVIAEYTNGSTYASASTTTGYSANTWHHACGVFQSGSPRQAAYIDGGSQGTNNTNAASAANWTAIQVGGYSDGDGDFDGLNGRIAHAAIWSRAFSATEVAALPFTRHDQFSITDLVAFYELWGLDSPERDTAPTTATKYPLTITGSWTQAGHAPVTGYSPRWWRASPPYIPPAGGGRTTKNTRAFPLGMEIGMGWVMPNQV